MDSKLETICPKCKSTVSSEAYFCPNCGQQLKNNASEVTLSKKIIAYSVSLFLPPFGLWYAWKYFKAGDYESKKIAITSIILTIISLVITLLLSAGFVNSVFQSLNEINSLNL